VTRAKPAIPDLAPAGPSPTSITDRPGGAAVPLLRGRNFQLLLSAQLLGSGGVWMLRMAADWLVLEITGSPAAVGVLVALQFLPLVLVGPPGGVIADRHDKRRLVLLAQTCAAGVAVTLALLTLTHTVVLWHLYVLALTLGLIAAVEMPARQVLVSEVVGDSSLRTAISLSNALSQGGGMVGPAVAGLVIAGLGLGWAFGLNALVCLAVVALLAAIRPTHRAATVVRGPGQLREGFRFVVERPDLLMVVVLAGFMGALGLNGPVVFSAFADRVWHTGAGGFGLYNSVSAVGALAGVLVAARLPRLRVRTVVIGAGLFGIAETVAAVMPNHATFLAMLGVVGAATMFFLTSAATFVQLAAQPSVRGRVLAIYSPVLLGGHACGGLLQGWLAEELGVRTGLAATGVLALVATSAVGLTLVGRRRRGGRDPVEPAPVIPQPV
jgi:MFS family permease